MASDRDIDESTIDKGALQRTGRARYGEEGRERVEEILRDVEIAIPGSTPENMGRDVDRTGPGAPAAGGGRLRSHLRDRDWAALRRDARELLHQGRARTAQTWRDLREEVQDHGVVGIARDRGRAGVDRVRAFARDLRSRRSEGGAS